MKPISYFILLLLFVATASVNAKTADTLQIEVEQAKGPVFVDNENWVYAEIRLTNHSDFPVLINSITVSNSRNVPLLNLTGGALEKLTNHHYLKIQPKARTLLYLEVPLKNTTKISQLIYQIRLSKKDGSLCTHSLAKAFYWKKPIMLDAPLSGRNWAAVYDPAWERGHRRVYFSVDQKSRIPGRYAIDFIKLNDQGQFASAQADSIANWYGYGAEVLAVSDGKVAYALDTFPESRTLSTHPKYDSTRATGNYISIKIEDGVFAFYEHLKPGSIKVKAGDRVKAGQVIGNLGFTGQSTGPHLHFHLADHNSPLGSEGIPYGFKQFTKIGAYPNFNDFGKKRWAPLLNKTAIAGVGRPASNSVIGFSGNKSGNKQLP